MARLTLMLPCCRPQQEGRQGAVSVPGGRHPAAQAQVRFAELAVFASARTLLVNTSFGCSGTCICPVVYTALCLDR